MKKQAWHLIKSNEDYEKGMERLLQLAENELLEGSDELDEFELLNLLIGHYEDSKYTINKPDPIEAIKFRMDQEGLTQADMRQYIGSASKVSEVLNYRRPLSLSMIKRLHTGLGIPADILIQDVNNIEWSPISYGAEDLVMSFGDRCKKALNLHDVMCDNEFEEIANAKTGMHFKTQLKTTEKKPSNSIKLGWGTSPSLDIPQHFDFQGA